MPISICAIQTRPRGTRYFFFLNTYSICYTTYSPVISQLHKLMVFLLAKNFSLVIHFFCSTNGPDRSCTHWSLNNCVLTLVFVYDVPHTRIPVLFVQALCPPPPRRQFQPLSKQCCNILQSTRKYFLTCIQFLFLIISSLPHFRAIVCSVYTYLYTYMYMYISSIFFMVTWSAPPPPVPFLLRIMYSRFHLYTEQQVPIVQFWLRVYTASEYRLRYRSSLSPPYGSIRLSLTGDDDAVISDYNSDYGRRPCMPNAILPSSFILY